MARSENECAQPQSDYQEGGNEYTREKDQTTPSKVSRAYRGSPWRPIDQRFPYPFVWFQRVHAETIAARVT